MKKPILYFSVALAFIFSGCNSENAEEAVQGYFSKSLEDLKEQLPEELQMIDSLLLDSASIQKKIAETTNIDSLERYNKQLMEAKNLLKKDISKLDSISPEIMEILDLNL